MVRPVPVQSSTLPFICKGPSFSCKILDLRFHALPDEITAFMPKPRGAERPLGIPTIRDWVVQTAAKIVLEPSRPHLPPLSQQIERLWRQHDVAVFASLSRHDADDVLCAVDI